MECKYASFMYEIHYIYKGVPTSTLDQWTRKEIEIFRAYINIMDSCLYYF